MNRRSAFKTAIGVCAAMLFPWRKAPGKPKCDGETRVGKVDQVARITRLLEVRKQRHEKAMGGWLPELKESLKTVPYRSTVQRHVTDRSNLIKIRWDKQQPTKDGRSDWGVAILAASLAASMDDTTLTDHLAEAFFAIIAPPSGKVVWIGKL